MSADPPVACTVVGAGVAGVCARLWLRTFELPTRWLAEDGEIGGILDRVHNPLENFPGANFEKGRHLADALCTQVDELDDLDLEAARVTSIRRRDDLWRLETAGGKGFASRTVLLATGTRYRRLEIPGEQEGLGDYVSQSTARDADRFAGCTVAIVGGGDAGFEGALQLADREANVHMLLRNGDFKARPQFVERARQHRRVTIHPFPTTVERIEPLSDPRGCRLHVDRAGTATSLEVACLFVRIGVDPVWPDLSPEPEHDEGGYLAVDRHHRTSLERLYAAGEVTDTPLPCVATATGGAARAAHAAAIDLGYA